MRPIIQYPRAGQPRVSYPVSALAQRYGFLKVSQQTKYVAVISLGGGFSKADVTTYCQKYSFPVPNDNQLRAVSIDGAKNDYTGDPASADSENALDVQTILGASGGRLGILVYFAKNDGQSFARAVRQVALDNVACALSISWGQAEAGWSPADRAAMDAALQLCASMNIPVFVASGDAGSGDGLPGNNVDYPSSSPYALGCGGTTLHGTNTVETAWSYGGGGLSRLYPRPAHQMIGGNARGVPDVAGDADPQTGYDIVINGQWGSVGGTSAVSPLWAAGVGLVVSVTGRRVANLAAKLYTAPNLLTDITQGSNGAYHAGPTWDPCCGLGVPNAAFWNALANGAPSPPTPIPVPPAPLPPAPVTINIPLAGTYQRIG